MAETNTAMEFLVESSFCVLAVADAEGKPHAGIMHFAAGEDVLFDIFMATSPESRKAKILARGPANASFVVGSGDSWKTLQMDGTLRMLTDEKEKEAARRELYGKYPQDKYQEKSDAIFMHFKATWYRYTDFSTEPPLVMPWGEQISKETIVNPD